jgi:6,7-dimethyl-8-ribityllumazine synthase
MGWGKRCMQPDIKLGIVVAEFNQQLTGRMLTQALKRSSELNALTTYVCKVPGSYDMPLMIQTLLDKPDVDAVVTLGAIVRGKTKHNEVIAHALLIKMVELSLYYKKPVTLGVAGPGLTIQQGKSRITDYANRSVDAAIKMVLRHRNLKVRKLNPRYPVVIE